MPVLYEAMTWDGYWVPHITAWILGGIIPAAIGAVIGLFVRRWIRHMLGEQTESIEDMKKRMDGLLTFVLENKSLEQKLEEYEKRLKAMERYAAEHETEQAKRARLEAPTRSLAIPDRW